MPEDSFENELERMFAQAPAFADEEMFAQRVGRRIERLQRLRRWLYGGAAAAGGLIAITQVAQWAARSGVGLVERAAVSVEAAAFAPVSVGAVWAVAGAGLLAAYIVHVLREA